MLVPVGTWGSQGELKLELWTEDEAELSYFLLEEEEEGPEPWDGFIVLIERNPHRQSAYSFLELENKEYVWTRYLEGLRGEFGSCLVFIHEVLWQKFDVYSRRSDDRCAK